MNELTGWGRQLLPGRELVSQDLENDSKKAVLFRGLGRSYGDSSIPPSRCGYAINTRFADRLRFLDRQTGILRAEAGLSLLEINRLFLRDGWFVPVSPGTQYVTLGGMVAADVHGKNHHRAGSFGEHVRCIKLRVSDGRIVDCSEKNEPDLFHATIGGMGLTGHILEIEFFLQRIPSPWIWQETIRIDGIEEFIHALQESARDWPFTVGWIDCLSRGNRMGRGILMRGRWANPKEAPPYPPKIKKTFRFPITLPSWIVNRFTVKLFNSLYFHLHVPRQKRGIVHPESFFYPLDAILDWNKMYGSPGFTQYQCVLPEGQHPGVTERFMELVTTLGRASFLCVIKDCGAQGRGLLSFPKPGITIALDIPMRRDTQSMIDTLNEFVIAEQGRINLCKDFLTRAKHFQAMEDRLDQWQAIRNRWDPQRRIRSAQSVRLLGDSA